MSPDVQNTLSRWCAGRPVEGQIGGRGFGTRLHSVEFSNFVLRRVSDATIRIYQAITWPAAMFAGDRR